MVKNPAWTRAFRVSWDSQHMRGLYVTEREAQHEASGVVFGSGLVALDSGATYDSLDELHGMLAQVGEVDLEWVEPDRWWWLRVLTSLFLVWIIGLLLGGWRWHWFGLGDTVWIVALIIWYFVCCFHVHRLHQSGAFRGPVWCVEVDE